MIVAASGPLVVGFLTDHFGWVNSFGFLTALLVVVGCLVAINWAFDLEL